MPRWRRRAGTCPTAISIGAGARMQDHAQREEHADDHQRPGHLAADDPLGHHRHQPGLRGGQGLRAVSCTFDRGPAATAGRTSAAATTPISSPTCIFHGVPPSTWPTFRSCIMSPAIRRLQQTTAATPSTPAMPPVPEIPNDDHQQRGDDQGREGQARDRVVRAADQADEVARRPRRRRSPATSMTHRQRERAGEGR